MAERSYRNESAGFASDDPFAELTRIMGHDPRLPLPTAQEYSSAAEETDDFSLDMESELMGSHQQQSPHLYPVENRQAEAAMPAYRDEQAADDLDLAFEAEFAGQGGYEPESHDASYEDAAPAAAPGVHDLQNYARSYVERSHTAPAPAATIEDELSALLAQDDAGPAEEAYSPANAEFGVAAHAEPDRYAADVEYDLAGDENDSVGDAFDAALAEEMREGMESEFASAFGDVAEDEVREEPYAAPAAPAAASFSSVPAAAEEPDLEFVEIAERPSVVSDDLDIPELAELEETPPAAPMDDFEGEFGQVFAESAAMPAAAPMDQPLKDEDFDEIFRQLTGNGNSVPASEAAALAGVAAAGAAAYAYRDDGRYQAPQAADDEDAAYAEEARPRRAASPLAAVSGNKYLIGVSAAALVLVLGVGALAYSFFGGESNDAPALVRAEVDPVKVRPENPGGSQVANQSNPVYDRVSSGAAAQPEQQALVTTSEQPVDITARTAQPTAPAIEEDDLPLGEDEEAMAADEASDDNAVIAAPGSGEQVEVAAIPVGKSEERVQQVGQDELTNAESDMIAVAPKRVRTLVVRPDGTMVPREEPVQQAAAPTSATGSALAPAAVPAAIAAAEPITPPSAPAATARPQMPAAQPPARQQPAPQQVAAAAPEPARPQANAAAAGTPSSEWSMQIASQPTPEGAQATYRDLLQRYGGVLAGRGVQIVKAEIAGKGTFYRVRIPSSSKDEAVSLCGKYKAAGGNCFVSK